MANEVSEIDSILLSTKKMIGIVSEAKEFDTDLIIAINTVLNVLHQIGVGNENYIIKDESDTWQDYLGDSKDLEMIKTYVALKAGFIFDPPQHTSLKEVKKALIDELEWRISVTVDPGKEE